MERILNAKASSCLTKRRIKQVSSLYWLAIHFSLIGTLAATQASGGNVVYVGNPQSAKISMDDSDHSTWNSLLSKYVDSDGKVNYQSWKANAADVHLLDEYLRHLSDASRKVPAKRAAKLAFWINAYNALTVRGILREYPTSSIRNHTAKLWGYNIWEDLQLHVGGEPVSLERMEHEILRKMSEPRIHFAIVCASVGCPRLLNQAYRADQLDSLGRRWNDRSVGLDL